MVDATGWDPEARYAAILERARADPSIVGVVVFGSRGAGAYVDDDSDVDAFVVVAGTSAEAERWATEHGSDVEIWPMTLDEFRAHGLPETPTSWNRPSFLRARIDLDRLDGEIGRIVEQRRRLAPDEAPALAASALGAYINALYRSLRNLEAGRLLEGRLDAAESIGPLLTTAFALEGRVRPFNKWLPFELAAEPFALPDLEDLLDHVERVLDDPTTEAQRRAFRAIERAARSCGHGSIVDAWEPDVAWLRGLAP